MPLQRESLTGPNPSRLPYGNIVSNLGNPKSLLENGLIVGSHPREERAGAYHLIRAYVENGKTFQNKG